MFDSDKLLAPAVVVWSSAIFGLLAWRGTSPSGCDFPVLIGPRQMGQGTSEPSKELTPLAEPIPLTSPSTLGNLTATTLLLATIPYSLLLLEPLTQSLEAKAADPSLTTAEVEVKQEQTTHWLVDRWATVNLGRAVLCTLAAGSAIWAGVSGVGIAGVRVVSGVERMGE